MIVDAHNLDLLLSVTVHQFEFYFDVIFESPGETDFNEQFDEELDSIMSALLQKMSNHGLWPVLRASLADRALDRVIRANRM
jgi:hypothetical protein